jgi:hypothetical protein
MHRMADFEDSKELEEAMKRVGVIVIQRDRSMKVVNVPTTCYCLIVADGKMIWTGTKTDQYSLTDEDVGNSRVSINIIQRNSGAVKLTINWFVTAPPAMTKSAYRIS